MLDNNLLIKSLEDYKDKEKYSTRQLAEFLSNTEGLKDFYQEHIDKINEYIKKYPRLIVKFSKDINYFSPHSESVHYSRKYEYTKEEENIIYEIVNKQLIAFGVLYIELNNFDILRKKVKMQLALDFYLEVEEKTNNLIDYIIKFCNISPAEKSNKQTRIKENKKHTLKYFDEADNFTLDSKKFKLSETERSVLKEICNYSKTGIVILRQNVARINKIANKIIGQNLIGRKEKNKPYQLSQNINYID